MNQKTAWAHWSAVSELLESGRELGHAGLLIQHSVLDQAIVRSLSMHLGSAFCLAHEHFTQGMGPGQKWLVDQLTWSTAAGCSLHDFHNSFGKAMAQYFDDTKFMHSMYGIFAALRDTMLSKPVHTDIKSRRLTSHNTDRKCC